MYWPVLLAFGYFWYWLLSSPLSGSSSSNTSVSSDGEEVYGGAQSSWQNITGGIGPQPQATSYPTVGVEVVVVVATPVPTPTVPVDVVLDDAIPVGYTRSRILGRFSNYWPPLGGTNCHADCERFADGGRVDEAIAERQRVVACPPELLLGTRIEWPPTSGVVWTCRDRGDAIRFYYAPSGMPVYWFDFLLPDAAVDYGSYIQVDLFIPVP